MSNARSQHRVKYALKLVNAGAEPEAADESDHDAADAHAWQRMMSALRDDEANCDVVFVVGRERLPAMRCLCAAASETFDMLLGDSWRDGSARGADVVLEELIDIEDGA